MKKIFLIIFISLLTNEIFCQCGQYPIYDSIAQKYYDFIKTKEYDKLYQCLNDTIKQYENKDDFYKKFEIASNIINKKGEPTNLTCIYFNSTFENSSYYFIQYDYIFKKPKINSKGEIILKILYGKDSKNFIGIDVFDCDLLPSDTLKLYDYPYLYLNSFL